MCSVLTEFAQAAVLGQHLPKPNLFKDRSLSQVHRYCSGVEKIKTVKRLKEGVNNYAHALLSKAYQQVCGQRQGNSVRGQICMLVFHSFRITDSSGDAHSRNQRSVIENETRIHTTSASREREFRIKRLRHCDFKSTSFVHSRSLGQDVSAISCLASSQLSKHHLQSQPQQSWPPRLRSRQLAAFWRALLALKSSILKLMHPH